jgi:hypothetical protein
MTMKNQEAQRRREKIVNQFIVIEKTVLALEHQVRNDMPRPQAYQLASDFQAENKVNNSDKTIGVTHQFLLFGNHPKALR